MKLRHLALPCLALASLSSVALSQDSVSKTPCLPGDGIRPYSFSGTIGGSEQKNNYVVDLTAFNSSWGTTFGTAPILKSSATSTQFSGSLVSAQGMSRRLLRNVPFPASSYDYWQGVGFGVNNDTTRNDPGTPVVPTGNSQQFAVAFSEFSTTSLGSAYNGVIGGLVNIKRNRPARLYVQRTVAAVNNCDEDGELSQMGLGSVDANGNIHFRTDDFGVVGPGPCSAALSTTAGQNIFRVNIDRRDPAALNVISNDFVAGGLFDKGPVLTPTTEWLVRNSADTHSTPGIVQAGLGTPLYVGMDFNTQYVRGTSFGGITADSTHITGLIGDQRGTVGHTTHNYAPLGSTNGICASIGLDSGTFQALHLSLWGIDAGGSVTGTKTLTIPSLVTDNSTGVTNLAGDNEFNNYGSQVPFRGGNGQVSMWVDSNGDLFVAATADHPDNVTLGNAHDLNYIAVAKCPAGGGATEWTMAAYVDGSMSGKPVLDGPGGSAIGNLVTQSIVLGAGGPSMSSPMFDSAGNIWFVAPVLYNSGSAGDALIRAVYDPATFSYELEMVLSSDAIEGKVLRGRNSTLDYVITFLPINDSNSVSSTGITTQNISEDAHLGRSPRGLENRDPRTLGGLVFTTAILYDYDGDGDFENCINDPLSEDLSYNVIMYVGYPGFDMTEKPSLGERPDSN